MSFADELKLVAPEDRGLYEEAYEKNGKVGSEIPVEMAKVQCPPGGYRHPRRTVYVTFYTHSDHKIVRMYLDEESCFEEVAQKAAVLLPTVQWKICSGTQYQYDFEFHSSRQLWDSIQRTPICRFYYLLIRLERLHPVSPDVRCDSCKRSIIGHRFKCTECADFDICQSCEGLAVHSEHAMLRIVNSGTHVPGYITANAPSYVFGH
ncbi:hypothetical protein CAEBREN_05272 [Caenorhabditis brenneri]|uniref:ZZ-type domain-containing protein n=1 Tax=Caenorhabditis brenneri TaxID=135651 RepID=G0PIS3_CAEBE|nr:hypothetical protein CAEBREN_05272 [Caenorhabditis brenneri]